MTDHERRMTDAGYEPETVGRSADRSDEPGSRTAEIEREIEHTRAKMTREIDEISERLRPANLARETVETVRHEARRTTANLADMMRENSLAVAAVGLGATWAEVQRRAAHCRRSPIPTMSKTRMYLQRKSVGPKSFSPSSSATAERSATAPICHASPGRTRSSTWPAPTASRCRSSTTSTTPRTSPRRRTPTTTERRLLGVVAFSVHVVHHRTRYASACVDAATTDG